MWKWKSKRRLHCTDDKQGMTKNRGILINRYMERRSMKNIKVRKKNSKEGRK